MNITTNIGKNTVYAYLSDVHRQTLFFILKNSIILYEEDAHDSKNNYWKKTYQK